jgi:hypothetical protein
MAQGAKVRKLKEKEEVRRDEKRKDHLSISFCCS